MKTLIFVSHSSVDNGLTDAFCKRLENLLGGSAKCQILVDTQTLETGGLWPVQLHEMMAGCHAAVVLLSENALKSRWVLKELTILSWRKSLEPDFKLFIAQFPTITEEQTKQAGYEPLEFRRIQGINSNDPGIIATSVHAALEADAVAPVTTLFDRLAKHLGDLLRQADEQSLRDLAQDLGATWPNWRPQTSAKTELVESICRQLLRGELGTFPGIAELFDNLKTKLPPHSLGQVLKLVAPHWVDAQAAGQLGSLLDRSEPQPRCRLAAINGNHAKLYTGRMYLDRAFPLESANRIHGPNPPADGDVIAHYKKAICSVCRQEDEEYRTMGNDDDIVNDLAADAPWLFIVIAPLDKRALDELQATFPTVRFVIDVGVRKYEEAGLPVGVAHLVPPVDPAVEERRRSEYRKAKRIVNEAKG